jgi:hypothetical protein
MKTTHWNIGSCHTPSVSFAMGDTGSSSSPNGAVMYSWFASRSSMSPLPSVSTVLMMAFFSSSPSWITVTSVLRPSFPRGSFRLCSRS